jgi:hypothetical protein
VKCLRRKSYLLSPGDGRKEGRLPATALVWVLLMGALLRRVAFAAMEALVCSRARRARDVSPRCAKTSPTCIWNLFPPQHTTLDKGHGRVEVRSIWTRTALRGYLDFPYAAQVFTLRLIGLRL